MSIWLFPVRRRVRSAWGWAPSAGAAARGGGAPRAL